MKAGLGVAILAGLIGCGSLVYQFVKAPVDASQAALVETEPPSRGPLVTVAEAVRGTLDQSFVTYGNLTAYMQADIAAQIDGQVESVLAADGAIVKQGQVIVALEAAVADAELKATGSRLDAAKAAMARVQTLLQRGDATSVALEDAGVKLALVQTEMALKQETRKRHAILAPFAGQITRIALTKGEQVTAGKPISRIYDQERLRVEFQMPERLWTKVREGQRLTIQADGNPDLTAKGKVSYVAPNANPNSRSLIVVGLIDNADHRFAAGLFVNLSLDLGAKENVVLVPETAIVEKLSGSYVFIVEKDKSFERQVKLGERRDGKVEVVSGIDQGQHVVVSGQKLIRDNMAVVIAQQPDKG
jgi:membrane fusion protein (multidrug efflux system)